MAHLVDEKAVYYQPGSMIKAGWLVKRALSGKTSWKKRYIELTSTTISYKVSPQQVHPRTHVPLTCAP